ncbi:MAG: phosphate ABC transporter permease subunit PstC [Leptolyngbyaceae cyanobacterium SM1_1_3]|nr:phosphate ABC transporter permease subunit PstC [Leptolyngbyaceae cyanobacterium SM1_1_3]NJM85096.1 phosphate ABC transporter permease subunit PstC [Leptolyngbyaceae cyanobacterium RM2_2_21]NJN02144.1 phosphate ABC transporter permease subunit PstC [Leptolyngbyaceae cyanobacterium RM1_1_2]NJO08973.1 phosphate ABC transporter permease subunit PstC [Leptolyngbyaceae cyanobacterium SL_1_1]
MSKLTQKLIVLLFGAFAFVSVATTIGIVLTLIFETIEFFLEVSPWEFFTGTRWSPTFANPRFGIIVLLCGTFLTSVIGLLVAVPLGLLSAVCLSEYAPRSLRAWLKPALEILAGVPTVVFGYFALLMVTPFLKTFIPGLSTFNSLSAGLVLGFAVLPTIASLSEDAIFAVPLSLRQGSYALGATKRETVTGVVLPAALSGIVASIVLGVARAVGETMIVTLAAGQSPTLTLDPRSAVQTMTSFIVQITKGDAPYGSIEFKTLFAVGMTLFVITLVLNFFSFWFVRRFQEKYE